jgi:hypothetical protein
MEAIWTVEGTYRLDSNFATISGPECCVVSLRAGAIQHWQNPEADLPLLGIVSSHLLLSSDRMDLIPLIQYESLPAVPRRLLCSPHGMLQGLPISGCKNGDQCRSYLSIGFWNKDIFAGRGGADLVYFNQIEDFQSKYLRH